MLADTHPLRSAKWIWPQGCPHMRNTHARFRRDFHLARVPRRAPFFITADQSYMLYVNGRYVGRGPARGFQTTWAYDEFDLAPYLTRGRNWLSVRVYAGGISTFGYLFEWHAGLMCAARWRGFELTSDADWLSSVSPAYRADATRVSVQLNLQEQVDARLDDQSWIRSSRAPGDWQASTARPFGVMPWHALEPRGAANLGQFVRSYQRTRALAEGCSRKGYEDVTNVADLLRQEVLHWSWKPAPQGKIGNAGLTVTLPAAGRGRFVAVTLDMGEPTVGTLLVDARGTVGGETLDLHFAETEEKGGAAFVPRNGISMAARLTLAKGRTQHELYHLMGHRYLTAIVRDSRRPVTLTLAVRETLYPLAVTGGFTCSDETLRDIHRISVRTQQVCTLDSYVDTPWREQAQWWGDARVQARNTFHLSTDARLVARGIRIIARQGVPNGLTYSHAPTNCHGCVLPDFSLIWAITLWDYYWQTGDASLFVEQWPRVEQMLGYFTGEGRGKNGLLRYDERYWLFLDWTNIHKQGTPTLLNLWYLFTLDRLAELARIAKMPEAERRLRRLHGEQKRLVLAKLWDKNAEMFRDGLMPSGKPVQQWSIHNQTLAVMCGLQKDAWDTMLARQFLPYLRGMKTTGALPSSYWVTYVYGVATDLGYAADVVRHLREKFAPMIPYGGTWETFEYTPGNASTTHAWAAHPIYHLAGTVGGVRQTGPAWSRVTFDPLMDLAEVAHAETTVPTPHGPIRTLWRRRQGEVTVSLALPKGVTADVALPGARKTGVTGRHTWSISVAKPRPAARR